MSHDKDKGVTGRLGDSALRVDPLHWDISKADMIPTHPYMLNQAVEALLRIYWAQSKHNPRLQNEYAFVLVIMAAAMFEAVVNVVLMEGFKVPTAFYEFEKSTPLAKWIALRGLNNIPDFASEPAGGLRALYRVRNTIVHAKPDEGKKLIRQKGLQIVGVLRVSSVDRMLASAVLASCDAVAQAPWNGRLDGSAVWAWPIALDNHGPLRHHVMHLPNKSITRTTLLALAPPSPTGGTPKA